MGLTLNFELRLPDSTSVEQVREKLGCLRDFALTQPFAEVSALLPAENASPEQLGETDFLTWIADAVSKPFPEDEPIMTGDSGTVQGFIVHVGDHCEAATFALLRRADSNGTKAEWHWHGFCKTQYASVVSETHFITCHTSLVRVLDHAVALGLEVIVRDEGGYWETRDETHLIGEVRKMNRLVAGFAGVLGDAINQEGAVRAPILEHPRFEKIEMGEE